MCDMYGKSYACIFKNAVFVVWDYKQLWASCGQKNPEIRHLWLRMHKLHARALARAVHVMFTTLIATRDQETL